MTAFCMLKTGVNCCTELQSKWTSLFSSADHLFPLQFFATQFLFEKYLFTNRDDGKQSWGEKWQLKRPPSLKGPASTNTSAKIPRTGITSVQESQQHQLTGLWLCLWLNWWFLCTAALPAMDSLTLCSWYLVWIEKKITSVKKASKHSS